MIVADIGSGKVGEDDHSVSISSSETPDCMHFYGTATVALVRPAARLQHLRVNHLP